MNFEKLANNRYNKRENTEGEEYIEIISRAGKNIKSS